jgi:hypothetical protein
MTTYKAPVSGDISKPPAPVNRADLYANMNSAKTLQTLAIKGGAQGISLPGGSQGPANATLMLSNKIKSDSEFDNLKKVGGTRKSRKQRKSRRNRKSKKYRKKSRR